MSCAESNYILKIFFLYYKHSFLKVRHQIYVQKTIPHRDCSEMVAISKYVSNIAIFV